MNRSPHPGRYTDNVDLAEEISENPTFAALGNQLLHDREMQAMRWQYVYQVSGTVVGQQTAVNTLTTEAGTSFMCRWITMSAFSYDSGNDSSFPVPNSAGSAAWAGRGLSVQITDSKSGRELTSGFVAMELIGTPGYGMNFQHPFPFRYLFYPNSKLRFDIRNRDAATRTHYYDIALTGFKILQE
jgi:hypothetical protein